MLSSITPKEFRTDDDSGQTHRPSNPCKSKQSLSNLTCCAFLCLREMEKKVAQVQQRIKHA